ncbi:MAG: hypothetical protein ACO3UU_11475, partial [Minisyncoccia bacterium]
MIKYVKVKRPVEETVFSVKINSDNALKYIGQSGTCGYACAAKGYIADYILRNVSISWLPLHFDNSKNDKHYYIDA